jgi:hypothetical protein
MAMRFISGGRLMNANLTRAESDALRDACMSSVLDHAESDWAEWGDIASAFLHRYAQTHTTFTAEDVTFASMEDSGFPQPVDLRAWGPPFRQAVKAGVIEVSGTGRSMRRHSSVCNRYSSRVFA